jgi:hypothetical protein
VAAIQIVTQAFMPDAQGDLPGQGFIEGHGFLAENVAQIDLINPLADKVAGIQKPDSPGE